MRLRNGSGLGSRIRTVRSFVIRYGLVILSLGIILMPFLWLLDSSLKPSSELLTKNPSWIVRDMSFQGYAWAMDSSSGNSLRPLFNSFVASFVTMVMATVIALPAGYSIARYNFPGISVFLILLFLCQLFQGPLIMIPWYKIAAFLKIVNTKTVLVLIYGTMTIPVAVVMLSGFFKTVPISLEESAFLDGCSRFQTMVRIDLPILKPGIMAVAVLSFISAWNDYQYALIFTTSPNAQTIQMRINEHYNALGSVNWPGLLAMGVIATLPAVILFAFAQRYLIDGLTSGAIKG